MSATSRKAAFTLIELLVVISIMLIATAVLFVGGGGGSDGVKLSSAQRIVSSIAQGVRGKALQKNSEARLIIYSENNPDGDPDKLLRYFGIVYGDPDSRDAQGNYSQWFAATQGDYLPEGIYFDPTLSASNNWPRDTMNLEYPRQDAQTEGRGDEYYYYKFNANGTMATDYENSWLVLRAGTLKPVDGDLSVDFSGEDVVNLRSALIFRRVGTTTVVTDPTEISGE